MLQFQPWRQIVAEKDLASIRRWMQDVADSSHRAFRAGSEASNGGRVYRKKGGRLHRASAPGAWPAKDTGRLLQSLKKRVTASEVEIGTSVKYAIYLRKGTRKMARRKMSDDALRAGTTAAASRRKTFARFRAI